MYRLDRDHRVAEQRIDQRQDLADPLDAVDPLDHHRHPATIDRRRDAQPVARTKACHAAQRRRARRALAPQPIQHRQVQRLALVAIVFTQIDPHALDRVICGHRSPEDNGFAIIIDTP